MNAKIKYLEPHPRSGVLRFRRVFPPHLRPYIPGPTQLMRSISAKKITEPGAMSRFAAAAAEYDRIVAHAEKLASATFDQVDEHQIITIAAEFASDQAEWIERRRLDSDAAEFAEQALQGIWWMEDDYLRWRIENDVDEMIEHWGRQAAAYLADKGITLGPTDRDGLGRVCRALNDTAISIREDQKARLRGEVVPVPPRPALVGRDPPPLSGRSFEEIAGGILKNPRSAASPTTRQAAGTALRFFREVHGSIRPAEITTAKVSEWLDLLQQRPKAPEAVDRDLALPALVAKYAGRDVERMSKKTMATHLGHLRSLWRKAQGEEGAIPEAFGDPFKARKSLREVRREKKVEFSLEELHAIFRLPVFTAGERPVGGKGEASYWIPLLLLFTGARPEDVAQLRVSDFSQDKEGRWFIRFTDEGEHPIKGKLRLKTSEHETGRRTLPLPKPLLDLNLAGYLEQLRAQGELALFPALRLKGGEDGRQELHGGFSAWWSKYVRAHKVLPEGQGRRPLREFRDVWNTGARMARIPKDAREYIQGRTPNDDSSDDDYGQHEALGAWLHDWRFEGLDLSAVKPWKPR